MAADIKSVRLSRLGHQIADVEPRGARGLNRGHQLRNQKVGKQGGVQTSGAQEDQIGIGDGFEGAGQGWRTFRQTAEPNDRAGGLADVAFTLDAIPVFKFRPEAHIDVGGRNHLALHRKHPTGRGDGCLQIAGDGRQCREEEVAEAVPFKAAAGGEAVLKQPRQQGLLVGESGKAVADVSRWQNPQLPAKHPAAATVIRHGDDRRDVTAVALQSAQQRRQPCATPDCDDVGPTVEAAFGPQCVHQDRVLVRNEGALNRPEASALSPEQKPDPQQHHEGSGDFAWQHRRDEAEKPAQGFQNPVNRLQIRPDGCSEQGHEQSQT